MSRRRRPSPQNARRISGNILDVFFFSRRDYSSPKQDDLDEFNLVRR